MYASQPVATIEYTPKTSLNYSCMHCLVTILDTVDRPNLICEKELPTDFKTQLSTVPLPKICNVNKNQLLMLDNVMLLVHLGHAKVTLKFIFCESLAAPIVNGADFRDQHVNAIRPKHMLADIDSGDFIPII